MLETTRVQYRALIAVVAEKMAKGEMPSQNWIEKLYITYNEHPDWEAPPIITTMTTASTPPPPPASPPSSAPPPPPPTTPPKAATSSINKRKDVFLNDSDDDKFNDTMILDNVLKVLGSTYEIFQSGGHLLVLQTDPIKTKKFIVNEPTSPRMISISSPLAWFLAGKFCRFIEQKEVKGGAVKNIQQRTPEWLGRTIVAQTRFSHIPIFAALAQAPTLRSDGALISEPGYDESTGIYLATDVKVNVPTAPTLKDAQEAAALILDLVCDFDFSNPGGNSVWLAGLLSIICRHAFTGPAPMFMIDASKRGSGKTMLADLASLIAIGSKAACMYYTADDAEMDKRITALAIAGDSMVLIDNIVGRLASPSLDMALTSTAYKGRVLGKTEMTPTLSMKIVWWGTGNGLVVGADTARRILIARLEPTVDYPEDRTGPRPGQTWKYPNLLGHVRANREKYLSAALTIVSAYIQAGRPEQKLAPMGSFEGWSATIRSAIVWAGCADPCETVKFARGTDLDDLAQRRMIECWPVSDGVEVTAATLLSWCETIPPLGADSNKRDAFEKTRTVREMWRNALLEWLPAKKGDLPTAKELGYALRTVDGSIIGEFRIRAGKHTRSGTSWRRESLSGGIVSADEPTTTEQETETKPSLSIIK